MQPGLPPFLLQASPHAVNAPIEARGAGRQGSALQRGWPSSSTAVVE